MITGSQQLFINKAIPVFKKDKRIVGVALGGAYARGTMDEYSDLEFIIAVEPALFSEVLSEKEKIAASIGNLLAAFPATHMQRPDFLICMYGDPLVHVDLNFQPLDKIWNRMDDPVIQYERGTQMSDEYAKTKAKIPEPDLQWYEDRFWIWVHYIANKIGRNELFDAIEGLSFLRQQVLGPMILMKNGYPPRGVREIELACPMEIPRLVNTLASHDQKSCLKALKAATDLYIYLRGFNVSHVLRRETAEKKALQYLNYISERI